MSEQESTLDEFVGEKAGESESIEKNKSGTNEHSRYGVLPTSWRIEQLSDITDVIGGSTPSTSNDAYWGGGIPWATPTDITGLTSNTISETADTLTQEGLESTSTHLLPPNSVLMTSRATIGECAVNTVDMATNQGFKNFVPGEDIETWYLFYRMQQTKPFLESLGSGSTFDEISKSVVKSVEIPVPTLPEQRKIATVLYTVDRTIEKIRHIIQQLHQIKTGYIQESILNKISKTQSPTDLGELPTGWEKVSIEEVASDKPDSLVDGPFGSSLKSDEFVEEGYARVIQLKNVREAKYVDENLQFVTREKYDELERHGAKPGDIYIAKMASPVARACILPDTYDQYMMGCADVVKLEPSEEFVDEFVMYCLNSYPVWKQAAAHIRGGGRMRINLNQLKEVHIPKPPLSEQKRIVGGMNSINSAIDVHEKQKENIHRLKQGLMQDLLSGTVRTTDTNITVSDEVAQHG